MRRGSAALLATLFLFCSSGVIAAGCGSSTNGFGDDGSGNGDGGGGTGPGSGIDGSIFTSNDSGDGGDGSFVACATSKAEATLKPVNLVMLLDKSGSMGDGTRSYSCGGGPGISCGTAVIQVNGVDTPKYVCLPQGTTGFSYNPTNGDITIGSGTCPVSTLGGSPAVFCADPTACTVTNYFDPAVKWVPVGQTLQSFFADPASTGLSASLQFFPILDTGGAVLCQESDYATPPVPITALPNGAPFQTAIAAQTPAGNTPTEVALKATVTYAKTVATAHPNDVNAIVLVTDGLPTLCGQPVAQDVSVVAAVAQTAAADTTQPIKTYVIGVGDALTNLDQIAAAGGTGTATIVSVANPTQTATDFQAAMSKIRGSALTCNVALPAPPDGQQLDINAVNVEITVQGKPETLTYNKDCSGNGLGWHYDDAAAPKEVQLCPSSCDAARKDDGKINILFGCATRGGVK